MCETKFYICKKCGNIVGKIHNGGGTLVCCGEKMKLEKPKRIGNSKYHIEGCCKKDGSFMAVIKICETPQKTFPSASRFTYLMKKHVSILKRQVQDVLQGGVQAEKREKAPLP